MSEVVYNIILPIVSAALTAIVGYIGVKIKALIEKHLADKTKRAAARTCVKAVEQLYKDLHGEEKYNKCVEQLTEILAGKGIEITELEIRVLIEAAVQELNAAIRAVTEDG